MKLIIFGSTGGTGKQIVAQALQQGHTITAFTPSPDKINQNHEKLHVVKGDVMDLASVEHAMKGQEAVLCSLGLPANNKSKLRAKGTSNIILAMKKTGVKRLVCQSALGVADSSDLLPFHFKYFIVPLILRHVFADHRLQEDHIKKSKLDWIIVQAGNLTDGKLSGSYQHGFTADNKTLTLKVSRADVADFMIKQITDDTYLHKTPGISY